MTYLKEPSVPLAIQLLDGTTLRPGTGRPMTVVRAKFEPKAPGTGSKKGPQVAQRSKKELAALAKKQEKDLDWGGFDDRANPRRVTVVLHNMFTVEECERDPNFKGELEQDVHEECSSIGRVEKVEAFPGSAVVTVQFTFQEDAEACVNKLNGRWFASHQISAGLWDGATKFLRKRKETEEEQRARLDAYMAQVEAGSG